MQLAAAAIKEESLTARQRVPVIFIEVGPILVEPGRRLLGWLATIQAAAPGCACPTAAGSWPPAHSAPPEPWPPALEMRRHPRRAWPSSCRSAL
jgi:hypothetical protein